MKRWTDCSFTERAHRISIQGESDLDLLLTTYDGYFDFVDLDISQSTPAKQLTSHAIKHTAGALLDYVENLRKQGPWIHPVIVLGPVRTAQIAMAVAFEILLNIKLFLGSSQQLEVRNVLEQELNRELSKALIINAEYIMSQQENRKPWHQAVHVSTRWNSKRIACFIKKYKPIETINIKMSDRVRLSTNIIEILSRAGFLSRTTVWASTKSYNFVTFNEDISVALLEAFETDMLNTSFKYRPMIIPPEPHTLGSTGGSRLAQLRKPAVDCASMYFKDGEVSTNYRVSEPTQVVIDGLNKLMATEWAVNERVFSVMEYLYKNDTGLANLPFIEKDEVLLTRQDGYTDEVKAERQELWSDWYERGNDRLRVSLRLRIARDCIAAGWTFFHVYTCDFRGRAYTTTDLLSPQSGDHDKALATFARAVPQTERGIYWLKVHLAGCFDHDKEPFDERIAWVDANMPMFKRINDDPLQHVHDWATDTSNGHRVKKDKSFQRLAAIFELLRTDGLTQLPVQVDGSCNGIQWWAALAKDAHLAKKVNIVPDAKPDDVYQEAADKCWSLLTDTDMHVVFKAKWDSPKAWRKVVKRSVMTDPYGVTNQGIKAALRADGFTKGIESESLAALELSKLICAAKDELMQNANLFKDWLRSAAKLIATDDKHVYWTTPTGFFVKQEYFPIEAFSVQVWVGKKTTDKTMPCIDRSLVAKRQTVNAISPNIVHSLDAAHMFFTIDGMAIGGITEFCFIHDSYGTHATRVDDMNRILREQFVRIHDKPILEGIKLEWETRYNVILGPLPPMGDLDITQVVDSLYFFH
jgi:DNA-directed RNA polymerase